MIELDRLSTPPDRAHDNTVRGGVQRDRYGAPLGYHIRKAHPTEIFDPDAWQWKYVPARKPWGRLQVLHILEQMRPDQTRGISDMVTALTEMQITKRFRKIVLQNAVVNATYAASIESDLPSEAVFASLGAGDSSSAIAAYAQSYLGAIAQYVGSSRNLHLDGVKIPHLFPGTRLQLRPAGSPGGVGQEFEQSLLRYIAANLGVSYEQLSKDYSKTNYSSARAGMVETWKFMQSRKRMVADRQASSIYRLWLEEAINKGDITSLPRRAPSWYEGLNADAYSAAEWIGASRGQIDELKETQAAVLRLKYNLSTHEDELARQGKDWRKVFAQREREAKDLEARGLNPEPEDNTMNAASGDVREKDEAVSLEKIAMMFYEGIKAQKPADPVINVKVEQPEISVQPNVNVDVIAKPNGRTRTRIVAHDEKGRIQETETYAVDDEESDDGDF
jgi:lambda family phage portal protein